jgi:hypothetical protein
MLTGRRYGGAGTAAAGIPNRSAPEDVVLAASVEKAQAQVNKADDTLGAVKARIFTPRPHRPARHHGTARLTPAADREPGTPDTPGDFA